MTRIMTSIQGTRSHLTRWSMTPHIARTDHLVVTILRNELGIFVPNGLAAKTRGWIMITMQTSVSYIGLAILVPGCLGASILWQRDSETTAVITFTSKLILPEWLPGNVSSYFTPAAACKISGKCGSGNKESGVRVHLPTIIPRWKHWFSSDRRN